MRTTLSPSFTASKMKFMFNLIKECIRKDTQFFTKTNSAQSVQLKDVFTRYTNDILATVAFGVGCDSLNERENEFYLMGKETTTISFGRILIVAAYVVAPKLAELIGLKIFAASITKFFKNLVEDTIKIRVEKGIVRPDMIHLLLEARKDSEGISNMDIAVQCLVFFFAGFETVSTSMCFMGYELALNPDVQKRLQQEIDETFESCNGDLTYEALMKMKYLDMVVMETLRKWPPLAAVDRVCTKPYTIAPGRQGEHPITLQRGDMIWIPICAIQRDPNYFPDPEKFDPERFNDDNKHNINQHTFFSFGVGPRICIGSRLALMEVKTVFFYILRNFDIVTNEKSEIPLGLNKGSFNMVPEKGMWFDLKPRAIN